MERGGFFDVVEPAPSFRTPGSAGGSRGSETGGKQYGNLANFGTPADNAILVLGKGEEGRGS